MKIIDLEKDQTLFRVNPQYKIENWKVSGFSKNCVIVKIGPNIRWFNQSEFDSMVFLKSYRSALQVLKVRLEDRWEEVAKEYFGG